MNYRHQAGLRQTFVSPSDGAVWWVVPLAAMVAWVYSTRVEIVQYPARNELQNSILDGTALEPYRFRVLVPNLAEAIESIALSYSLTPLQSHQLAHLALNTIFISALMLGFLSFVDDCSLGSRVAGLWILSGALHIGLYDHGYQPWSLLEAAIVVWAAKLAVRQRFGMLPVLAFIATLNRDTGVLLPVAISLLAVQMTPRISKRNWLLIGASGAIAVATYGYIRIVIGSANLDIGLMEILAANVAPTGVRQLMFNLVLMLGFGWAVLLRSSRISRQGIKRLLIALSPFVLGWLVFGIWHEVRLLIPVIWVLIVVIVRELDAGAAPAVPKGSRED